MISLKLFFKQKMVQFLMIMFAGVLLISNLVLFTMSNVQYERETNRQINAFSEMVVHLLTMESTDTAITYMEHYNHIQGIDIAFYNTTGNLVYETSDHVAMDFSINLADSESNPLGTVYYDDQNSNLGNDLTMGLLIMNGFSILIFLVFLKLLYSYLNNWYKLIETDLESIGTDTPSFYFQDIESVSLRLKESMETLERLKEYQKEYVKMLAHDIKTPLTVIKAYLEGVKLGRVEFDETVLEEMMNEVDEIERMIPKFMTQNIDSTQKHQNIGDIIETIINRLLEVFQTKHIQIKQSIDDYMMTVSYLDITRVVEHLLFNAYYYNKERGMIEIELNSKTKILLIRDSGIGMSDETLNKIRKGPYRADMAKQFNQKGSGIGLQVVFEILQRLELEMEIDSTIDEGTTFTIHLP